MDYKEYVATVEVEVMGVRHSISIPYLDEEYDEDSLYDSTWHEKGVGMDSYTADIVLSEVYYSLYATFLSFSAHLLRVCETSHPEAWSL